MFKAYGSIGAISKEEEIHHDILRKGLLKENIILGNALVDMYAKSGMLENHKQYSKNFMFRIASNGMH